MSGRRAKQRRRQAAQRRARARQEHPAAQGHTSESLAAVIEDANAARREEKRLGRAGRAAAEAFRQYELREPGEARRRQRLREAAVAMLQEPPPGLQHDRRPKGWGKSSLLAGSQADVLVGSPDADPRPRRLTRDEIMAPGPLFPLEPWGYELGPEPAEPAPSGWAPEHTEVLPGVDVTQVIAERELVPA